MSEDSPNIIYRPLFVLVEAVEAEIKRLLVPAQALAPIRHGPTVEDYQRGLRLALNDDSIVVQSAAYDTVMIVGHRCRVCQEFHRAKVREEFSPTRQIFVEKLVRETKALLEKACNIELRTP
jgi:hypothetical protein